VSVVEKLAAKIPGGAQLLLEGVEALLEKVLVEMERYEQASLFLQDRLDGMEHDVELRRFADRENQ
jgi:hypothetical protein